MNHLKYKAIALDLDGTLTDSNKKLPPKNKEAIWKAMDFGVTVILASGRPIFGMTGLAKELELDQRGGILAPYNGGRIFDCKTGALIKETLFPPELIPDTCRMVEKYGCQPLSYTDTQVVAEDISDPYIQKECFCNYATALEVDSLPEFLDYPIPKILGTGEHEKLLKVQKEFLEKYSNQCDCYFAESYFLELTPKGVSKDQALAHICSYLQIQQEELLACGDGLNDITMLQYAGLGVAMKNAYPETKAIADFITPVTNDECGVAWAIEHFILQS